LETEIFELELMAEGDLHKATIKSVKCLSASNLIFIEQQQQ
jgi:hypothetical protein